MMESSGSSFDLPQDTDPVIGGTRTLRGLKIWEKLFLVVSFVNIVVALALTIQRLVAIIFEDPDQKDKDKGPDSPDFTFALVLFINCLFCAYYVINGVLKELKFELYAFIGAAVVVTLYCVIEYSIHSQGRNTIKLVRMIMILLLAPVNIWLAYMVAREFGFLAFRIVGASEMLQRMYTQTEIFTCLLKFDVQVAISFVVLVLQTGSKLSKGEIIALGIGVPYTLILAALGWIAMRNEMKSLMWTFDVLCLASPAFVLFKVVQVYQLLEEPDHDMNFLDYAILSAGALALTIRGMILVESFIIMRNFNYGLKETAFASAEGESRGRSLLTGIRIRRDGSVLQNEEDT